MKDLVKKEENNNWTSKKELMNNLQISPDTIEQIISDLSCRRPADTQNHIKKGGYHNSEEIPICRSKLVISVGLIYMGYSNE